MLITNRERRLCQSLQDLPAKHGYRYNDSARNDLLQALFNHLAAERKDVLLGIFRGALPAESEPWSLRDAQGLVEGAEYSEEARGRRCGHIFKNTEAVYRCKNCEVDETCVLCSRCFNASEHDGHNISVTHSSGNGGCCDCGDPEAWKSPVICGIHAADSSTSAGKAKAHPDLPDELLDSIRMTIGRTFDYICDVISCSPEQLRLQKTEDSIRHDERLSHLASKWYEEALDPDPEFALVLWNDEKHTVDEVTQQVARACKREKRFGLDKANETNDYGRSVVTYSKDVKKLLKIAKIIEEIKITVTIRSSRDTFREQMCGTMVEWLQDIDGCSIEHDHDVLRNTICEEMLKSWRTGSAAANSAVGKEGMDDHEVEDARWEATQLLGRHFLLGRVRPIMPDSDSDANSNENDLDDGDDEADSQANDDEMDLDLDLAPEVRAVSRDLETRTSGEPEDPVEVSEATYAGYPPPPPPPPAPRANRGLSHQRSLSSADTTQPLVSLSSRVNIEIPRTPLQQTRKLQSKPPAYWLEQPEGYASREHVPLHEDLRQRIRLDWLILFDLRLWKKARTDLRELYIQTVVTVPTFKRILGLRFAGLYTVLSQLYLIADREPDHSIIHLSTQMLTTPSIIEEIVERGNFLTALLAILYTFLTRRQVGHPWEVSVSDTLAFDAGSVTNRRTQHLFAHLKHLFDCDYVRQKLHTEARYTLQVLDLIRLPQGICPNVRAVGEHVEYETDTWIGASLLIRDINRTCRVFSESFTCETAEDLANISRVIRTVAKATVINATGAERVRFDQAEIKEEIRFKTLQPFDFEGSPGTQQPQQQQHTVVDFVVEKEPISFHHPLHYTLSWLIGQARNMSADHLKALLHFSSDDLREKPSYRILMPDFEPGKYLLALFDSPLRVCAWLAQMKASMWVRNGLSLRHQMGTYRGVVNRDHAHNRDIFLLQTALVVCNPSTILASMIDRFGMDDWMRGHYVPRQGFEITQQLDVAEDFIHLLIVLLTDRTLLQPLDDSTKPQTLAIRRDITHILCFKPMAFSELCGRLSDRVQDTGEFQDILEDMTNFKPPEGLSDSGTFELKPEYLADVDPYIAHFSKNQRDEAENAYRTWMARVTGKAASDIVMEPRLLTIESGLFKDLGAFTRTMLFTQIVYYSLLFPIVAPQHALPIPDTRLEAFLQVVLHLVLAAVIEDERSELDEMDEYAESFVVYALCKKAYAGQQLSTIFSVLVKMLENEKMKACHPKIRLIMHRIQQRRPRMYASAVAQIHLCGNASQRMLLDRLGAESPLTPLSDDSEAKRKQAQEVREAKKKQALDRQAKIMASFQQQQQNFEMANQNTMDWGETDSDDLESTATGATEEHKKIWKYPADNCLVCQEEVNDARLYGTFGLIMNSNIFRQTDIRDHGLVAEVMSSPANLDRSADHIRPFGLAGWNRERVRKVASNGEVVVSEHQGLGRGFSSTSTARGPVSTGCGHVMHYKCFETFSLSTHRRQNLQIPRNHPERLKRNEFVCPLCKALGNTFLPIIWKGKEEAFPGVLQVDVPFDEWLETGIGLAVTRFQKHAVGEDGSRHKELFMNYTSKNVIPPLAAQMMHAQGAAPLPAQHSSRSSLFGFISLSGRHSTDEGNRSNKLSPPNPLTPESVLMQELMIVYQRLRDTIGANELSDRTYPAKPATPPEDLIYTDTLPRTLGYSIAATEIISRGTQAEPGTTFLDKIPSLALTHLRILSETAFSYIAAGAMRNSGINRSAPEFSETNVNQLLQLFAGHPQIVDIGLEAWSTHSKIVQPPAISQDPFVFLAECSVCLVPAFNLEIHHIVRLCYLLELVKVVVGMLQRPRWPASAVLPGDSFQPSSDEVRSFAKFAHLLSKIWPASAGTVFFAVNDTSEHMARCWYHALRAYALPFLRKTTILLHVRYGLDLPNTGYMDTDEPELERLTRTLRLPSLTGLFESATAPNSGLAKLLVGWIEHWRWSQKQPTLSLAAREGLRLNHPVIFELIGLPKAYDTLTAETVKRRCPTTGKELTEPVLCLFCGAIFCSQATCCLKDGRGGCSQHIRSCGRNVGLFINIKKCNVLFLHDRNGSWHNAPYLDQYGEVDPGLRHSRQLFLNQRRYDALLRNVWLNHGIPTTISRKLEADINNGGWETL
ncbi:MAG: hypothetical protein Q9207_001655 [Kuettlingeria erythrocarpa]